MRTYTHGAIGYLIYRKADASTKKLAVIGAMVPDTILALGFPFHFIPKSAVGESLHQLFHHSDLHLITQLMHSFVFVIPLLLLAQLFYKKALPFLVGMLSHIIVDLLTHQQWGYNHFFPIPLEPFMAPVAYTSPWFTVVEHLFVLGFVIHILKARSVKL